MNLKIILLSKFRQKDYILDELHLRNILSIQLIGSDRKWMYSQCLEDGEGDKQRRSTKGHQETDGARGMFIILIMAMVSQVFVCQKPIKSCS